MHFLLALTAAAFLLPATAISPAVAQPIFRCGNTYSQEACKGGKVVEDQTTTLLSSRRQHHLSVQRPWRRAFLAQHAMGPAHRFSGTYGNRSLRVALASKSSPGRSPMTKNPAQSPGFYGYLDSRVPPSRTRQKGLRCAGLTHKNKLNIGNYIKYAENSFNFMKF